MTQLALAVGSLYGLVGVVFGAFGAHALASRLTPDMQDVWQTAVQYQFYHALALLAVGMLMRQGLTGAAMAAATLFFIIGVLVFSGSLYILALSGARWLGAITPIGGTLLIAGWLALLVAAIRS